MSVRFLISFSRLTINQPTPRKSTNVQSLETTAPLTPLRIGKKTTITHRSDRASDISQSTEYQISKLKSTIINEIKKREQAEDRANSLQAELDKTKSALVHMSTLYNCVSDILKDYEARDRIADEVNLEISKDEKLASFLSDYKKRVEGFELKLEEDDDVEIEIDISDNVQYI